MRTKVEKGKSSLTPEFRNQVSRKIALEHDQLIADAVRAVTGVELMFVDLTRMRWEEYVETGNRVLFYDDVPILELAPMKIETVLEDGQYKVVTTQPYRNIPA